MMVDEEQPQTELADSKKVLEVSRLEVKTLRSEKDVLVEQIEEVQKKLKKSQVAQKDIAIERAFLRAQEAELKARDRSLLSESDQLKADVQRLTKVNAALKDTEQKLQQAQQDLNAARAGSRKIEAKNRKLENKFAKMDILKTRARKNEEELQALRMLQEEHEAMIRELTSEKTALEARLARVDAPGVPPPRRTPAGKIPFHRPRNRGWTCILIWRSRMIKQRCIKRKSANTWNACASTPATPTCIITWGSSMTTN